MKLRITIALLALLALGVVAPLGAQDAKVITFASPQEPDTLNVTMYSSMFFAGILNDIYLAEPWAFDDQLQPVPVLATEIPSGENGLVSEDGRAITIQFRQDAAWSDGEPITAEDYAFTIEMITDPANEVNSTYPFGEGDGVVESVELVDEYTVVVTTIAPFAPWPTTISVPVLPEHVLRPVFEAEGSLKAAAWNRAPDVVSGPFAFAEWETGSFMRFVRNDAYWGAPANLDEIIITFVPDSEAYVATLLNGEAELGTFLDWGDLPQMEESGLFEVVIAAGGYNEQWNLNVNPETGHPALQDLNVRRAIALATNREAITNDLLGGLTYPPATMWEGTPYQDPELTAYPYDAATAAQLLDEAGWVDSNGDGTRDKDGVELVLRYVTNQRGIRVDTQAVIQQQLLEVGIGTELINVESSVLFGSFSEGGIIAVGDYDLGQWSQTTSFPDPNTSVFLCSQIPTPESPEGGNYRGYCNPELDALFDQANQETDPAARTELFHQISRLIYDEYIYVGIWYDADNWEISTRLENVRINALYPFWNITEWDLAG